MSKTNVIYDESFLAGSTHPFFKRKASWPSQKIEDQLYRYSGLSSLSIVKVVESFHIRVEKTALSLDNAIFARPILAKALAGRKQHSD